MPKPTLKANLLPPFLWILSLLVPGASSALDVPVSRYDFSGTGANLSETQLTTANVTGANFGRLFSIPVEGKVYAQPLYLQNLTFPGGTSHNTLFVATMDDVVYAFDADNGSLLWRKGLVPANATPYPVVDVANTNSLNIAGNIGIESTPVIDRSRGTIYLVSRIKQASHSVFRLHALDLTTGEEKSGSPVAISGTYPSGTTTLSFDPDIHNQRAGLTIAKGKVLVTFASHEDFHNYYGWLMAYNLDTLAPAGVLNAAPGSHGAAVWMSGRAPAVDAAGNVYMTLGNGFDANSYDGVSNFGESLVKLDLSSGISVTDWFTPDNWVALDSNDQDFGSSGPMLIPGTSQLIAGGKDGRFFLLDQGQLGKLNANNSGARQVFQDSGAVWTGPAIWTRSASVGGSILYNENSTRTTATVKNDLKAYPLENGILITDPGRIVTAPGSSLPFPGGNLVVSANGEQAGTGIVWNYGTNLSSIHEMTPGELRAYDAASLAKLWSSADNPLRDDPGLFAKFVAPLVVNGKVYLATHSNQVAVYGLLPAGADFTITALPPRQPALGGRAHYDLTAPALGGFAGEVSWTVTTPLPPGVTANFSRISSFQTGLDLTVADTAPAGVYRLTVTASSGALPHSQPIILEITGAKAIARPASGWSVTADSEETTGEAAFASNAIDGDPATYWHTQWSGTPAPLDHNLVIDLGSAQTLSGLSYLPRQSGGNHGTVRQFEISASDDGINWGPEIAGGSFDYSNEDQAPDGLLSSYARRQQITLDGTSARYVRFRARTEINGGPWTSAAELNLYTAVSAAPTSTPSPTPATPTPTSTPTPATPTPTTPATPNPATSTPPTPTPTPVLSLAAAPSVSADLAISIKGPGKASLGKKFEYQIKVTNRSRSAVPQTTATMTFPDTLGVVKKPTGCEVSGTQVICDLGTVKKKKSLTRKIKLSALQVGPSLTSVTVSSPVNGDPVPANDRKSHSTRVMR